MRWQHPSRGLVPPAEFIPFAEQTGYIRAITQLGARARRCAAVRSVACARPAMKSRSTSRHATCSITSLPTASPRCSREHGAAPVDRLRDHRKRDPRRPGPRDRNLQRLHALGCRVAIDDYGTGYSSLALSAPAAGARAQDRQVFSDGDGEDTSDARHRALDDRPRAQHGPVVVAEGVEDEPTLARLRELGCDMVQGYL